MAAYCEITSCEDALMVMVSGSEMRKAKGYVTLTLTGHPGVAKRPGQPLAGGHVVVTVSEPVSNPPIAERT